MIPLFWLCQTNFEVLHLHFIIKHQWATSVAAELYQRLSDTVLNKTELQ